MSDTNDTPESNDDAEIEGVDADDLANLEVDPEELGDDDVDTDIDSDADGEFGDESAKGEEGDPAEASEAADGDGAEGESEGATKVGKDEDRLNLTDDEDEDKPGKAKKERDENELATVDDEEADLATILQEKLRSGDDLPPDEDGESMDGDDVTDGTPLLQPRRPDEEHCQQCFLLVRKSAPKCPVDHDLCPLYPSK
jgi:hypothetical protein